MEPLDNIIRKIDRELLKLSKGESQDFDFIQALSLFRDEVDKHGLNKYLERKAAKYVGVYNDLCNGISKTISHTDTEYDNQRQMAKVSVTTQEGSSPLVFETIEMNVRPEAFQKGKVRNIEINKYSCLNKSKVSIDQPEDAINTWFRSLRKNERFDNFFAGVKGESISFEDYIEELSREIEVSQIGGEIREHNFESLLSDLKKYLTGITAEELYNAIKFHRLTPGTTKGLFRQFRGAYKFAYIFARSLRMTNEDFNACFKIEGGDPLHTKHWKPAYNKEDCEITGILEKHGFFWK